MTQLESFKKELSKNNIKYFENEDLAKHSTMKASARARLFLDIQNIDNLKTVLKEIELLKIPYVVLGWGSNTLFSKDYEGVVIKMNIKGKEIVEDNKSTVLLKFGAGESWHEFVEYCVNNNLAGNENLAYIPGTVGAAPVQNIGAYGQVQEDIFEKLEAINVETQDIVIKNKEECEFSYRNSVFKNKYKNKFIIVNVFYRLAKAEKYIPDTSYHSRYESLQGELAQISKGPYTLKDVFNAVISIRKKKLPQIEELGTLGSFFLNPFITKEQLKEIQKKFPNIQFYPVDKMQYPGLESRKLEESEIVKIPAGWLLEELGWKGKMNGNVGTFKNHALCVVTNGPASGSEVVNFINEMKRSVKEATGIELESEINII